jgi:hypothetical protein
VAAMSNRVASSPTDPDHDPAWSPAANPAVAALLDHLAEELAREYIRLMEQAARDDRLAQIPSRQET